MKNYLIEEIKCGISNGGIACGSMNGSVIACLKFNDGDKSNWLINVEFDGMPSFYLSDNDLYENLLKEDEDFYNSIEKLNISSFEGIVLEDYNSIFNSFNNTSKNNINLIRALIYITRCEFSDLDEILSNWQGKYVSDIEIPKSDVELEVID